MPRNEDGEFELLLGNRQLMSVFFIVVILLGVFFAMGYIVGRNASPVTAPEVASRRAETKPVAVDVPASTRETTRDTTRENETSPAAPKETASQQGPATQPATAPAPVTPAPAKSPSRVASSIQPESGRTYLQLSAIDHDAAEIMVELLRKKSFPAIAAEVPEKPGVFRVLVGPVSDADVNKIRADLQNASFPGKEAIKRTF
ncbi:MAG: Sporulation domain protein [Bryobacterales bacterium]|nr:Sporulation domain protein [Bryobacterales bacterium]